MGSEMTRTGSIKQMERLLDYLRTDPWFDNLLRRIGLDPSSTIQGGGP